MAARLVVVWCCVVVGWVAWLSLARLGLAAYLALCLSVWLYVCLQYLTEIATEENTATCVRKREIKRQMSDTMLVLGGWIQILRCS